MSQTTSGCSCGCGGHRAPRAAAAQESADMSTVAANVMSVLGTLAPGSSGGGDSGVRPGRKPGNPLGLRDVSAGGADCGCCGH